MSQRMRSPPLSPHSRPSAGQVWRVGMAQALGSTGACCTCCWCCCVLCHALGRGAPRAADLRARRSALPRCHDAPGQLLGRLAAVGLARSRESTPWRSAVLSASATSAARSASPVRPWARAGLGSPSPPLSSCSPPQPPRWACTPAGRRPPLASKGVNFGRSRAAPSPSPLWGVGRSRPQGCWPRC